MMIIKKKKNNSKLVLAVSISNRSVVVRVSTKNKQYVL